jgi:hypothetical protein
MRNTKAAMLIGIVGIYILAVADVSGQSKNIALKDSRISISMKGKPLFDVFMRLIYDYDVPIGFEQSDLDSEHGDYLFETNIPYDERSRSIHDGRPAILSGFRPVVEGHLITIDYHDASLEKVMDDVVAQMKNYAWRIDNEVVNIYPLNGRDPNFTKLLDTKINRFNFPKGAEVGMIQSYIILELPEFRTFLSENNLHAEAEQVGCWYLERPVPDEMSFSNLSFRDLLNAITRSKRGGWILKRAKPNGDRKNYVELII